MNFYCIGDEDTVRGFRLAGVAGQVVGSSTEAAAALAQAGTRPELGIVILTQRVAAGIRDQVDAFRLERDCPLLVEIPGPEGPQVGRRTLRQLVDSAIGIQLDRQKGSS